MKFVGVVYDKLVECKYFDYNVTIMFQSVEKKYSRIMESFYCCQKNRNMFTENFTKLKTALQGDKNFQKQFLEGYKDIIMGNMCLSRCDDLSLECFYYLNMLTLSMFIDAKGVLKIGNVTVKNGYTELVQAIVDPRKDRQVVTKIAESVISLAGGKAIPLQYVLIYLYPYTLNLMYPTVMANSISTRLYHDALMMLNQSAIEAAKGISTFIPEGCLTFEQALRQIAGGKGKMRSKVLLYSHIFTQDVGEIDKIVEESEGYYTQPNRTGFLKPEFSFGEAEFKFKDAETEGIFDTSKFTYHYSIDEIIYKDGVVVKYNIYNHDFVIHVFEDNIRGVVTAHIMFYDDSLNNEVQNIQVTAFLGYMSVREKYVQMINSPKYTNPTADTVDEVEDEEIHNPNVDKSKYTYKYITVAPYRRRLPEGQKASPEKKQEARRFNMILEDDETFVNTFTKSCRILKSTPAIDENEMKFEVKF